MENGYSLLVTRDLEEMHSVMQLMPRQQGCVACDANARLKCPDTCAEGTECGYQILLDCQSCPQAICMPKSSSSGSEAAGTDPPQKSKANIGPIVGGVVGGVAAVVLATYLVWRFCIKPRRRPTALYRDSADHTTIEEKNQAAQGDKRASMHTVHSVASTVLTRASNIIQIAYIPGVTNRAQPSSPSVLVPPVPPIPAGFVGGSDTTPSTPFEDQHFFMPGDLRDSTYSGYSGVSDRTSYARTSYAPRSSIASTIYAKNAIIQAPAQTGLRAKPTVVSVSVRSTGNSSSSSSSATPPVPSIDFDKYGRPQSTVSTFSVGSTFLSNASAATQGRAQIVRVGSNAKKVSSADILSGAAPPMPDQPSSMSFNARDSTVVTNQGQGQGQGPFSDSEERPLSAVPEASKRRSSKTSDRPSSTNRDSSPFGDEHAMKE